MASRNHAYTLVSNDKNYEDFKGDYDSALFVFIYN